MQDPSKMLNELESRINVTPQKRKRQWLKGPMRDSDGIVINTCGRQGGKKATRSKIPPSALPAEIIQAEEPACDVQDMRMYLFLFTLAYHCVCVLCGCVYVHA